MTQPRFIETMPAQTWSARVELDLPYPAFEQILTQTALETGQRYTGFITRDSQDNVTSYIRTRYPRAKYGIPTLDECREGMEMLSQRLDSPMGEEMQRQGFRVVLGLLEGYDTSTPKHTTEEVQRALPEADVSSAEVFAVRSAEQGVSVYREPVAVVTAPVSTIEQTYALGHDLKQERFTVENFEAFLTYVVETEFCTESDFTPEVLALFDKKFSGDDLFVIMENNGHGVGATMEVALQFELQRRRLGFAGLTFFEPTKGRPPIAAHFEQMRAFMSKGFTGWEIVAIADRGYIGIDDVLDAMKWRKITGTDIHE